MSKKEEQIVLSGFPRILHKIFWILIFPFRNPWGFVALALVVYLLPTFIGARPGHVFEWYKAQGIKLLSSDGRQQMAADVADFSADFLADKPIMQSGKNRIIKQEYLEDAAPERKVYEVAEAEEVQAVDVLAAEKNNEPEPEEYVEETAEEIAPAENAPVFAEKKDNKLNLKYLLEPRIVEGNAVVLNANEIMIKQVKMFLYGIYVEPKTKEGAKAAQFLGKFIGDDVVKCSVVAYTLDNVATASCTVRGVNINKMMVQEEMSQDVDLQFLGNL